MIGRKFHRLTVIKQEGLSKHGAKIWFCECECGSSNVVTTGGLRRGHTKSCGCLMRENSKNTVGKLHKPKHGMSKNNKFYRTWSGMKTRCTNPNNKNFEAYGGSGIGIPKDWLEFENFKRDMYESYLEHINEKGEKQTTLDRIENSGGYSKENCRWRTPKEQSNHRTNVMFHLYEGKLYTMTQLSEKFHVNYQTLRYRILISKWTVKDSVETPVKNQEVRICAK